MKNLRVKNTFKISIVFNIKKPLEYFPKVFIQISRGMIRTANILT